MANRRIEIVTPGILMTIIERLCNSLIDAHINECAISIN